MTMTMTETEPATAALAPISLAELDARAALQTRVDRKYVLPLAAAEALVAGLAAQARVLEIEGRRAFAYSSTHFDTADLTSYLLAAHGRRRRFKVRERAYLDSGRQFVEVKVPGPRGSTVKLRTANDHLAAAFVDATLARAGIAHVRHGDLRPTLTTTYVRTTLFLPVTASRVTVDTGLVWTLSGGRHLGLGGVAVVETKSASIPSAADRLLWAAGHRPVRISKYCTGLALLNGDLPANRWHAVLRRLSLDLPELTLRHQDWTTS